LKRFKILKKEAKRNPKSLRYTIWLYFMAFICGIIALLWIFQIGLLPLNYQIMKTRDIQRVAVTIISKVSEPDYLMILYRTAFDNNMSLLITDEYGNSLYSVDVLASNSDIIDADDPFVYKYRKAVIESSNGVIYKKINNTKIRTQTLLFGMYIGTKDDPKGFIFLNTPLEPIDSTISVLQEQLIYITIALLSLGLIISFFMAKKISHPIVNITKSAENLAHGNYNVSFDGEGYDESEKLASTLNYASTEISKVDNLRRDLIANISHDLRTPLTMVKAYAEMIRDLSGGIPEKREEHINIIIEESNRLSALVNDILDLSKIESGNQKLNISSFKIKEKLMEVLERYKLLSEKDGYEFIYEEDDEAIVSGDVIKIEQVLYNFINNAVNYTGEDKKVIIRQINKVKSVRIEISDTGKGIEPEMLPLIFDRYYRGEKSQREVIGTGLGLSIIKVILKNHNYPFGVQSELDKGSTFWFEIKREKEKSIKIRQ